MKRENRTQYKQNRSHLWIVVNLRKNYLSGVACSVDFQHKIMICIYFNILHCDMKNRFKIYTFTLNNNHFQAFQVSNCK